MLLKQRLKKLRTRERMARMPKKNTKPERQTAGILDHLGVRYVQWYMFAGYEYDLFCPDHNLLIEVNGDFWHSHPIKYRTKSRMQAKNHRHDRFKMRAATEHGKRIVYIWESDLQHRTGKVIEQLRDALTAEFLSRHLLEDVFPQYRDFYGAPKTVLENTETDSETF